ncbi:hypothetical protein BGX27_011511 [Mortierella sp. AM989]|nr:hypothetical protein BGX27_011511 [Mortierella sp. AM989]
MSASNATGHQSSSSQQVDPAIDKLLREQKSLKAKIDLLEAENKALKKSLYELSYICSTKLGNTHQQHGNLLSGTGNTNNSSSNDEDPTNASDTSLSRSSHTQGVHNDMVLAVGQLLSQMSAAQQSNGKPDNATPNTASGSDQNSRNAEAQFKKAADLIKVEDDNVRRLNMGNIVSRQDASSKSDGRQFFLKNDLKGHQGAVYAVQYSPNGKFLATGSFDKTVRIWDGTTNQNEVRNIDIQIEFSQAIESSGTTRNVLSMIDARNDGNASLSTSLKNDAMINSIYVYHDGLTVISGDSSGYLKTWDMRMGRVLQAILNEPTRKPISHIAVSKQRGANLAENEEPESRWLAVNSYDNVIRVYDRGFEPPTTMPRLIHSLKGYRNKHWPIKSAFFHGKDYIAGATTRRSGKVRGADGDELQTVTSEKDIPLESSLLLASGSMDPYVYLFDVGAGDGQYDLLQKLPGHTDRVYDVDFHPIEHVLASGSADFSVKVWGRAPKRKK